MVWLLTLALGGVGATLPPPPPNFEFDKSRTERAELAWRCTDTASDMRLLLEQGPKSPRLLKWSRGRSAAPPDILAPINAALTGMTAVEYVRGYCNVGASGIDIIGRDASGKQVVVAPSMFVRGYLYIRIDQHWLAPVPVREWIDE